MGAVQDKRTVFSTCSCIGGQQWPTQSQPRHSKAEPRDGHAVCTLWVHPPTSPCPAFSAAAPKVIAGSDSQDESFMPAISGYIRERVKGH